MKRRYAVQHGDTITVFKDRLVEAIEYWQARPGSVLVYKAHGNWGGQEKRSTRWMRVRLYDGSGEVIRGVIIDAGET